MVEKHVNFMLICYQLIYFSLWCLFVYPHAGPMLGLSDESTVKCDPFHVTSALYCR